MKFDCDPYWDGPDCHEQPSDHRLHITDLNQSVHIVYSHYLSY
jgi:hypothetical protein